ncbi:hypothetical protein Tco_0482984, partial [Tanacetum coccineum]
LSYHPCDPAELLFCASVKKPVGKRVGLALYQRKQNQTKPQTVSLFQLFHLI